MQKVLLLSHALILMLGCPATAIGQQAYSPLNRDDFTSAAFSIIYRDALCIVAPRPYPPKDAVAWKWQNGETLDARQAKLFRQPEIDVYVCGGKPSVAQKQLAYDARFELKAGELVQVIGPDGSVLDGKLLISPGINGIYRSDYGPVTLTAIADGKNTKQIPTGSPVVLPTGVRVIGAIVPARKRWPPFEETSRTASFTFEVLCLPAPPSSLDSSPKANDAVSSFLGFPKSANILNPGKFRWILPDFIWELELGVPMAQIATKRKIDSKKVEVVVDHETLALRPDSPLFYRVYYLEDPGNASVLGEMSLYGEEVPRLGAYPKTTRLLELLIEIIGMPTVFSNSMQQPQGGAPEFVLGWQSSGRSLMLRLKRDINLHSRLHVSSQNTNSAMPKLGETQKFGPSPKSIQVAFEQWLLDGKK
ncbi:MAG: hypothetical protein WBE58_00195 [Verrucomicrobiales bacterium]